uniref:Uncharacterized protein n=1 Tax=Aegilops tauschii subsp. strangulata TaxID=200361 RepID=A0A453I4K4_AEGTS
IEQLHDPNPCPVAAHLALDPRSGRHRRRPRARSKVRPPSPPASRSTPSSSRRPGGRTPSPKLHPTSTHPRTLPPLPEIEPRSSHSTIRRPSSCPPDIQPSSSRISIPTTSGAPSSCSRCCRICCYRGSIAGLPLLPDMLMPGIHLQAHYAATGPAAGAPSPSSCAPPESSRPRALSQIQILGKFDINGASWTKRGCLSLDQLTTKLGDVIWRSV